jgi:hypothetical protein
VAMVCCVKECIFERYRICKDVFGRHLAHGTDLFSR